MKKQLFVALCICMLSFCIITVSYAQPHSLQISNLGGSTASVCNGNQFSITFSTMHSFQLNIEAVVRQGSATGPIVSANPFPNCGDQNAGNNPIVIILGDYNDNLMDLVPATAPNNSTHSWIVQHLNPGNNIDVTIEYSILLDCSLIPQSQGSSLPNQSLFLVQTIQPFTSNQVEITPVTFPYIIGPSALPIFVAGNYLQESDMIFEFKNIGTAPAKINFEFIDNYLALCGMDAAYEVIGNIIYGVDDQNLTNPIVPEPYTYSFDSYAAIDVNKSLYIKQRIKIKKCITECSELKEIQFRWQCATRDEDFCEDCQKVYKVPFIFVTENPTYEITRISPQPGVFYDNKCPGESQDWEVKVENTSQFTTLHNINLLFEKGASPISGLVNVHQSSVIISQQCTSSTCATIVPPPILDDVSNFCISDDPLESFEINIIEIKPGESVIFEFSTTICDQYDGKEAELLGVNKIFNHWSMTPTCTNICDDEFQPVLNEMLANISENGISTHSANNPGDDINLNLNFYHSGLVDYTVDIINNPPAYNFGPATDPQQVHLNGLFGVDDDKQPLGYQGSSTPYTGILRAVIRCDRGLVIHPTFVVSITHAIHNPWEPVALHQSIVANECEAGEYYYYFNIADLTNPDDFFANSNFNFQLQTCCTADAVSKYSVTFSLLMNDGCYTFTPGIMGSVPTCTTANGNCPWLPLSRKGFQVAVHCPGCRAPGIIVDNYKMNRMTFGYEDDDNNRLVDLDGSSNVIPIDNNYSKFDQLKRDRSIHGDELQDRLVAHFEQGSAGLVIDIGQPGYDECYRGYTYPGDMAGMTLDVLQLRRKITHSNVMNVEITSFDFYIEDSQSGNDCINCLDYAGYFYPYYTLPIVTGTILHLNVTAQSTPNISDLVERVGDEYLFTFTKQDLIANNSIIYPDDLFAEFLTGQQYRLVVNYKVCGNTYSTSLYYPDPDKLELESIIENEMWLTGEEGFTLANHLGNPQMPNLIWAPSPGESMTVTHELIFQGMNCNGLGIYTTNDADQENFANKFKFYCETYGGLHYFFSTDMNVDGSYNKFPESDVFGCEKLVKVQMSNTIGRKTWKMDVFPYEFRQPALLPEVLTFVKPGGYEFSTPPVLYSKYRNYAIGPETINGPTIPLTVSILPPIEFDFGVWGGNFSSMHCMDGTPVPSGLLLMNDEESNQVLDIFLKPDASCGITPGFTPYEDTDIIVKFSLNTSGCSVIEENCDYELGVINMQYPRRLYHPNPNLQANFIPLGTINSPEICWGFIFTNTPNLNASGTSSLPNLFIATPVNPAPGYDFLSNWEVRDLFYNYTTALTPYPEINGIIPIIDTLSYNQNSIISGLVCATYNPCQGIGEFDLKYGWNCSDFPVDIDDPGLCGYNIFDVPLTFEDEDVNVLVSDTEWPPNYTLCDSIYTIACFKNMEAGMILPQSVTVSIADPTHITINEIKVINFCSSASPAPEYNLTGPFSVNVAQDFDLPEIENLYPTTPEGYLQQTDCICIRVQFDVNCHFDELWQLPAIELNYISYCGDGTTTIATFPAIKQDGSNCVDCFKIVKTANPNIVTDAIELVYYTIEVHSNNATTTIPDIIIYDTYPLNYTSDGTDPFGMGPITLEIGTDIDYIGSVTIFAQGYLSGVGEDICNIASLEYYNTSISGQDFHYSAACVDVIENCDHDVDLVISAGNKASDFPSGIPGSVNTIAINGNFTIDVPSFAFSNILDIYMAPGAEILVGSGKTLVINNTSISGCTKMWKGIRLDDDAVVGVIYESTIEDAHFAVEVATDNIVVFVDSEFSNNFVSLYSPLNAPAFNPTLFVITQNTFAGTGSMKDMFATQHHFLPPGTTTIGDYPLAAIVTDRTQFDFSLAWPGYTGHNLFSNMSNGIIGIRSSFNVINCRFEDIQPEPAYTGFTATQGTFNTNFNGSGIFAFGGPTNQLLVQEGFGNDATDTESFVNCNYGIFADRISLTSENNNMVNVNTAHRAQLVKSDVFIQHNRIKSNRDAIQLIHCDGSDNTIVNDNDILFGNDDQQSYAGIRVEETLNPNNNSRINYNRINFRPSAGAATTGIFARGTSYFIISNNIIEMVDNNVNHDGIWMEGCERNWTVCNYVTGSGSYNISSHQSAIANLMGDSPLIVCNSVDLTNNGLYILGTVQTSNVTAFAGNELNEHSFAFRYSDNATTDPQDFFGNRWNEPAAVTGGVNARNENSSWSIYNVNDLSDPLFMPGSQDPANWFQTGGDPNFLCVDNDTLNPLNVCVDLFPIDCPQCRTEWEEKIARGEIENDPYTEETKWMLKQGLYYKLDNNPSMLSDTLMAAFYYSLQSSFTGELKQVDDSKAQLYQKDSVTAGQLLSLKAQVDYQLQQAMVKTAQWIDGIENGNNNTSLLTDIEQHQDLMAQYVSTSDSLHNLQLQARYNQAITVETYNNAMNAGNLIETNERAVNQIYLATFPKEVYTFSPQQITDLRSIAVQCPMSGGKAVFKARSLYSLYDPNVRYNDRETCLQQGTPLRQQIKKTVEISATLYPNPASTEVTLEYDLGEKTEGVFQLYNAQSQPVHSKKIFGKKGKYTFDISTLPPGVFYFNVTDKTDKIIYGKLVVIR